MVTNDASGGLFLVAISKFWHSSGVVRQVCEPTKDVVNGSYDDRVQFHSYHLSLLVDADHIMHFQLAAEVRVDRRLALSPTIQRRVARAFAERVGRDYRSL